MSGERVRVSGGGGGSIAGLLGVAFVILKLLGVIAWPWIWVLAPFWIPIAIVAVIGIIALIVFGIAALIDNANKKK